MWNLRRGLKVDNIGVSFWIVEYKSYCLKVVI